MPRTISDHAAEVRELGWTLIPAQVPQRELVALRALFDRAIAAVSAHLAQGGTLAHTFTGAHYLAARCLYCWGSAAVRSLELPALAELAELTLGQHRLWDLEALAAMPVAGEPAATTAWHRDFAPERDRGRYLWCFLCLDDVGPANGATWVLPRSHHDPSIAAPARNGDPGLLDGAVQTRAAAGSLIALDPTMLHSSGLNRTASPRRVINIGLCSRDRAPVFDHWSIARRRLHADASARMLALLDGECAGLPATWNVLPPGWGTDPGVAGDPILPATTSSAIR
jgi:hypothetical protein